MNAQRLVLPPGHPLHPVVQSIWAVQAGQGDAGYAGETILPKGIVDIIFDLHGTAYSVVRGGKAFIAAAERIRITGVQTTALTAVPSSGLHLLGVCVRAEWAAALLALPLSEATDVWVEGRLVLEGAEEVWERLCEAPDFAARCAIVVPWLTARLRPRPEAGLLAHACRAMADPRARFADEGGVRIVAKSLYVSERHLRRLFLDRVGVSPSSYLRLSRFVRAMHLLEGRGSLTRVAHAAGYYDQAHFCRDFKVLGGITPSQYRDAKGPVTGHVFMAQMSD
ncbi:MAG TPA: helix-turn-helix transcriptional regulator [Longimicrobium sp.]|jgi:AraC-like DNA-binding protein|uniref:helix-turn-helix transcriptional regulator n=1 Tax=Longimicrobium sp. TaxID=2029185 RepID=UPI002ED805C1